MPIRVCVAGAAGRMGSEIAQAVKADDDLELTALLVAPGDGAVGEHLLGPGIPAATDEPARALAAAEVLVDFTAPAATGSLVLAAAATRVAFVSGATALGPTDEAALDEAARHVAVLHAPNMSRGIEVLGQLVERVAALLGDFDVEIVERHHRRKADAPSGTALRLATLVAGGRGESAPRLEHGRRGHEGPRATGTIGMHALRGGDWVGEHTVILAGPGETLELRHRAESRAVFVAGTLACVRFVAAAPPGRYRMAHVLAGA